VPGAGFSPEAVPGNSAENEETPAARISHFEESMLKVVDKHGNSFGKSVRTKRLRRAYAVVEKAVGPQDLYRNKINEICSIS
jgi:hypothetical protein